MVSCSYCKVVVMLNMCWVMWVVFCVVWVCVYMLVSGDDYFVLDGVIYWLFVLLGYGEYSEVWLVECLGSVWFCVVFKLVFVDVMG